MERPILFKPDMVKAIISGAKSQTRRIVKHIPALGGPDQWCPMLKDRPIPFQRSVGDFRAYCPHGQPGSRLWVRESHWRVELAGCGIGNGYLAYNEEFQDGMPRPAARREYPGDKFGHLPSIHLPRWASRLTLEITDIRVERIQEITEEDAMAEGIEHEGEINLDDFTSIWKNYDKREHSPYWNSPIDSFHSLWNSIHGKDGHDWKSNPFVWVISLKRLTECP